MKWINKTFITIALVAVIIVGALIVLGQKNTMPNDGHNCIRENKNSDWVSQEAYTEEIGRKFISGIGVEYTVVSVENNFHAGGERKRVVLESEDKKLWMIPNLPNFEYDEKTKTIYFNIHEYVEDSNYEKCDSIQ